MGFDCLHSLRLSLPDLLYLEQFCSQFTQALPYILQRKYQTKSRPRKCLQIFANFYKYLHNFIIYSQEDNFTNIFTPLNINTICKYLYNFTNIYIIFQLSTQTCFVCLVRSLHMIGNNSSKIKIIRITKREALLNK